MTLLVTNGFQGTKERAARLLVVCDFYNRCAGRLLFHTGDLHGLAASLDCLSDDQARHISPTLPEIGQVVDLDDPIDQLIAEAGADVVRWALLADSPPEKPTMMRAADCLSAWKVLRRLRTRWDKTIRPSSRDLEPGLPHHAISRLRAMSRLNKPSSLDSTLLAAVAPGLARCLWQGDRPEQPHAPSTDIERIE